MEVPGALRRASQPNLVVEVTVEAVPWRLTVKTGSTVIGTWRKQDDVHLQIRGDRLIVPAEDETFELEVADPWEIHDQYETFPLGKHEKDSSWAWFERSPSPALGKHEREQPLERPWTWRIGKASIPLGPIERAGRALMIKPEIAAGVVALAFAAATALAATMRADEIESPSGGGPLLAGLIVTAFLLTVVVFPRLDLPYYTVFFLQWVLGAAVYLLTWGAWAFLGFPAWWLVPGIIMTSAALALAVSLSREVTTD